MIAVFSYDFPHRKTEEVLTTLYHMGERDVVVIAAPPRSLAGIDRRKYWPTTLQAVPPLDPSRLAEQLGYDRHVIAHEDVGAISNLVETMGVSLGVVAGARILKRDVINVFAEGIVNLHPGPIPETSGLDAFFYTIRSGANPGVTTHFIDPRVDAGRQIAFHEVRVGPADTPEAVVENVSRMQITALRDVITARQTGSISPVPVDRPKANTPMTPEEKFAELLRFPAWRAARARAWLVQDLHEACKNGATAQVGTLLDEDPSILEARTSEGWTPLILAVHGAHPNLANLLLQRGADPNATGRKGTTVLMYAKTPLMGASDPDTSILDRLLAAGADASRRDGFGRGILSYLANEPKLHDYFARKGAA